MQIKIKLTFQRVHSIGAKALVLLKYQLTQIENAVTATCAGTTYRVGDIVPEIDVKKFAESRRDYAVKVKS